MATQILTEQHFTVFKNYAAWLIEKVGLQDWYVDFEFHELGDGTLADCAVNRRARRSTISLSSVWVDEEPTDERLKITAQHEVLELLLDDFEDIFYETSLSEEARNRAIERARHAIIHRLLRVISLEEA